VTDEGFVAVNTLNLGNAGNFLIQSENIFLDQGGISANSLSGQGGNLNLQTTDSLILRNASEINTRAGVDLNSSSDGGNINISTPVLVLLEGSSINANAFLGMGGNISIVTSGLFTSTNSEISSSSRLGVDGVVEINSPDIDPSSGLVELETEVVDFTSLIAVGCDADRGNTFVVTGRGGLPDGPNQIARATPSVIDWRSPFSTSSQPPNQPANQLIDQSTTINNPNNRLAIDTAPTDQPITEVQGWRLDHHGAVVLVADAAHLNQASDRLLPKRDCINQP
jgi:large exoprotein involved in heme utilization and adhesion